MKYIADKNGKPLVHIEFCDRCPFGKYWFDLGGSAEAIYCVTGEKTKLIRNFGERLYESKIEIPEWCPLPGERDE